MVLGHDLSAGNRTEDIRISEDVSFDTMLLRKPTLKGLKKAGFLRPSPIQLHGIPLGKCGFDLLLEAKSGTGKTAVFTVISLEKLDMSKGVQMIILAPTREIASQISSVIIEIGSQYNGLNVAVVMGGLPVKEDIEKLNANVHHIVVGSPGRLRNLIQNKHIDLSAVRLLVLDEADKLMEKSFLPDINYIFSHLPKQKQVIMSSATYPEDTKIFISKYLQKAQHVCPDSNSVLLGISQKVTIVPYNSNIVKQTNHRYEELKKILNSKQFKQCLVFCNYQVRVGELHRMLSRDKWPSEQLYGQQEQTDRLGALKTLQEYKCRILVSTDLAARGIDASNVDIVINFEPPFDWQTYLHRIGRAGRYGSYGTAISILSEGKEKRKFIEKLTLANIPLNLRDLWNDEPFNLSLTHDILEKHKEPDSVSTNNAILPKSEDKLENMLWNVLTTGSLEQHNNKPKVSSFNELCDSFNLSSKSNAETFSELINSFQTNQDHISTEIFEFQHVKVAKLPIDGVKYCNNNDTSYINQLNSSQNAQQLVNVRSPTYTTPKRTNGDFINIEECENERTIEFTKPVTGINDQVLNKALDLRLDESEINQYMMDKGSLTGFGKNNQDKRQSKFQKYKISNDDSSSNKINPNKFTVGAGNFPIAFEKHEQAGIHSDDYQITSSETENDYNETSMIDANGITTLKNGVQDRSIKVIHNHGYDHHYENTSDTTKIDPIKQALINAGLPTAFGKVKQNKNQNRIHKNKINKMIKKESKVNDIQQIPVKPQVNTKKISSSKTFTRENIQESTDITESDQSDTSFETNQSENNASKLKNVYVSTYSKTPCHYKYKENKSNSMEQHRGKIFDTWYNNLKHQTQSIQYALYIEELRKL